MFLYQKILWNKSHIKDYTFEDTCEFCTYDLKKKPLKINSLNDSTILIIYMTFY